MIKCLVTGGCGFIGSNLIYALADKGWMIDVVDDMSSGDLGFLEGLDTRTVHADLLHLFEKNHESPDKRSESTVLVITGDFVHENVLNRIQEARYDYVFHLAARPRVEYSVKDPIATTEVNFFKSSALFYACCNNVKRVVFSSSSSIFGNGNIFPTCEYHDKNPRSPYALQKYCCEQYASLFNNLYGLDIVSLRYFNVYGPHQYGDSPYSTAISAWCWAIKNGHQLRSDGDGTQVRDLTYVDDVVSANILAATTKNIVAGMAFNIGCGEPHSNNSILEIFKKRFKDVNIRNAPWRPGDVMKTHANINLAKTLLGYEPQVSLVEGIERTFEWWQLEEDKDVT